jgi:hypothetical protein
MISPKRILQICILSTLTLCATAVSAENSAVPKDNSVASILTGKTEAPSLQKGFNLAELGIPEPTNRSCTASTDCHYLGGTPIMCAGNFDCRSSVSWVQCEGGPFTYCTCNPSNITDCADPVGFCTCWNGSPTNGFLNCRRSFCW